MSHWDLLDLLGLMFLTLRRLLVLLRRITHKDGKTGSPTERGGTATERLSLGSIRDYREKSVSRCSVTCQDSAFNVGTGRFA